MNITVFSSFSKRKNSTKRPTGGTLISNVTLKNSCDIYNPTFELNLLDFHTNYVEAFGNYYWCDIVNLDSHRSELRCKMDALATYKTQISGYSGLVRYTSSSSDVTITDPRNIPTLSIANAHTSNTFAWSTSKKGSYIIGVASQNGGSTGCVDYYIMDEANFGTFCQEIYDHNIFQRIYDDFYGIQNSILSCIWTPFTVTWCATYFSSNTTSPVMIGDEAVTGCSGYRVTNRIHTEDPVVITVPYGYGSGLVDERTYIRKSPYCTGTMYLPFVGNVNLPVDLVADNPKLSISAQMDILTGDIIYYVHGEEAGLIATYTGNCTAKVPVAGASYDGVGVAKSALSLVVGGVGAMINPAMGAAVIGSSVMGAANTVESLRIHTQCNGSISSALGGQFYDYVLIETHQALPAEPNLLAYQAAHGMPYFKVATLGSLSGYIECVDASVSIPGDGNMQDVVNQYLNSGFYLE